MRAVNPKYQPILQVLQEQIAAGKFRPDKRLPSENELAARYTVSRPTAARAIRELVSLGLVERRAGSGSFIRSSAPGRRIERTFGLLVPGLGRTEILEPICNDISRFAHARSGSVLWSDSSAIEHLTTGEEAMRLCRYYIAERVDGLFFAPIQTGKDRQSINAGIVRLLNEARVPVVLLDRDIVDFPSRSGLDLVGIDNLHAGLTLTHHLLSLGHRRITFLGRGEYPSTTDLRFIGCREAVARFDPKLQPPHFAAGDSGDIDFVRKLLARPRPDAVICSDDLTAALLMQTVTGQLELSLPKDLAVAGFDDVNYSTLLSVPLTTMRQPCRAIAQAAVNRLLARIEDPKMPPCQMMFNAELVVRRSCGASDRQA